MGIDAMVDEIKTIHDVFSGVGPDGSVNDRIAVVLDPDSEGTDENQEGGNRFLVLFKE